MKKSPTKSTVKKLSKTIAKSVNKASASKQTEIDLHSVPLVGLGSTAPLINYQTFIIAQNHAGVYSLFVLNYDSKGKLTTVNELDLIANTVGVTQDVSGNYQLSSTGTFRTLSSPVTTMMTMASGTISTANGVVSGTDIHAVAQSFPLYQLASINSSGANVIFGAAAVENYTGV